MPQGALPVSIDTAQGSKSALNLVVGATLVKAAPGRVMTLVPNNVGTTTTTEVSMYDSSTTAGTALSNLFYAAPDLVIGSIGTPINIDFPFQNGLVVVVAGTAVCSVEYQ